jgi:hypothetical protein
MPDNTVQSVSATGTNTDTPLKAPVSDTLSNALDAKLDALLKSALLSEPAVQEPAKPAEEAVQTDDEEKMTESTSEETPANAEATEDNALSQEPTEDADNSESEEPANEEAAVEEDHDLPKGVKKRLSKLSAAKRELEEKLRALEAETVNLKQRLDSPNNEPAPAPLPSNPYLHLDSQAAVEAEIQQARRVRRWAEENADGATVADPKTGKEIEYTSDDIRRIKLNAIDALEEHLPRQLNYVQTRAKLDPVAESTYNWWKDRSSREFQAAQQMLTAFPELRKFPDYKLVIGDYLRGAQEREASYTKQKATAAKPVVKKAPVQPTKPAATPAPVKQSEAKAQAAVAKMRKAPTTESLKEVLLSQFL